MADDLDLLFPEGLATQVAGLNLVIRPLTMSKLGRFSKAISPVMPYLMAGQFKGAAEAHYETTRDALEIATGIAPSILDELLPDAFVGLLTDVVTVNSDFFVKRLAPQLQRLAGLVALPAAGPSSPPSSQGGDTTLTPSDA